MRCLFCKHGETVAGSATVTLQRGETTVVFKDVPAEICRTCGEEYVSDAVSARLLAMAEAAVANGAEVEILRYAA